MTEIYNAGNPYDVVRTSDGQYQASDGELVITDADTLQLPEPADGEYVLVKGAGVDYVDISTPVGNVGQIGEEARFDGDDAVMFVSDGNDWYIRSDTLQLSSLIPDEENLHSDWDVRELSGYSQGDTVSSLDDVAGDNDLDQTDGSPSYQDTSPPSILYDGSEAHYTSSWDETLTQPNTIYAVFDFESVSSADEHVFGGNSSSGASHLFRALDDDWGNFAGSDVTGESPDTDQHIYAGVFDSSNSVFELDNSQIASGDPGPRDLDQGERFNVATHASNYGHLKFYRLMVYDIAHDSETRSDVADYLNGIYEAY